MQVLKIPIFRYFLGSEVYLLSSLTVSQMMSYVLPPAARALTEADYQLKAELVTNRGD